MADAPWLMRTYAGHTSARASNRLYRENLSRGQTGLSVAFDLPTQCGYDPDHPLARGEVGKVGVPVASIEDLEALFEEIPLDKMNVSMTIIATAPWLLALYMALAERRGIDPAALQGTVQNDLLKEYLSRGTYIYPPAASLRLTRDTIVHALKAVPRWNPINVCSYHLQEAGATPVEEVAYALAAAVAVLDAVRASGEVPAADFARAFARFSFFLNSGVRFIEETCKVRAFARLWESLGRERYGVTDAPALRFRYGVQVNSLGLTAVQPENNVPRIVLSALGVLLSRDARARALQLPAWNEALGLPRPWDQQWSLRIQQILAYETDLLEHPDIFEGSKVVEEKTAEIAREARAELDRVLSMGGAVPAVESGYMKSRLVRSNAARLRRIESGEQVVVGVNRFTESAESPLTAGGVDERILKVDPAAEREEVERVRAFRARRDGAAAGAALEALAEAARGGANVMPASIRCAHAGVTTGEWADALRGVFGEYRAPTGLGGRGTGGSSGTGTGTGTGTELRAAVERASQVLKRRVRFLVAKPGLDGHSNGAEQIALRARDAGIEVVYQGIRLTPAEIARAAVEEDVHAVGLSILSGSHLAIVPEVISLLKTGGAGAVPVFAGGIIPPRDAEELLAAGVRKVFTPKDFSLDQALLEIVEEVARTCRT